MTPNLRTYVCRDCEHVRYTTKILAEFIAHMARAHETYIRECDIPTLEWRWNKAELAKFTDMNVRSAGGGKTA